jgi:hypothetical protein
MTLKKIILALTVICFFAGLASCRLRNLALSDPSGVETNSRFFSKQYYFMPLWDQSLSSKAFSSGHFGKTPWNAFCLYENSSLIPTMKDRHQIKKAAAEQKKSFEEARPITQRALALDIFAVNSDALPPGLPEVFRKLLTDYLYSTINIGIFPNNEWRFFGARKSDLSVISKENEFQQISAEGAETLKKYIEEKIAESDMSGDFLCPQSHPAALATDNPQSMWALCVARGGLFTDNGLCQCSGSNLIETIDPLASLSCQAEESQEVKDCGVKGGAIIGSRCRCVIRNIDMSEKQIVNLDSDSKSCQELRASQSVQNRGNSGATVGFNRDEVRDVMFVLQEMLHHSTSR